ncbi:RraA family protein [Azospirillum brasilense]|uniref:RraA family protein n=1 Tax=Azospirillum brasilense TaxID=192 RepID=UPI001EDB3034|nr:RraA family protein [Azospirillum brasilense]UKJ74168.1 RraA family protein [Azospirillum brasilense]
MAMQRYIVNFPRLSPDMLEIWKTVPSSIASDVQNRCQSMDARIKPCAPGMRICGQARTAVSMPGDNSMLLTACSLAEPGEVVVVAGAGLEEVALAGEWVVRGCKSRGLGGLVIDGSVRDLQEIRTIGFPVFAKGSVPRGPHKAFGGKMDVPAGVGGMVVNPGDLIIGDDDGVTVVPLAVMDEVLRRCLELMAKEKVWSQQLDAGKSLMEVLGVPEPEIVETPTLR